MEKKLKLTKLDRRNLYLQTAENYCKKGYKQGLCLELRDKAAIGDYYWNTPKNFKEYGLINPNCDEHQSHKERIIALLLAYELTF